MLICWQDNNFNTAGNTIRHSVQCDEKNELLLANFVYIDSK